jgi:hypothetical protein
LITIVELLELGSRYGAPAPAQRVVVLGPLRISVRAWLEPELLKGLGRHRIGHA